MLSDLPALLAAPGTSAAASGQAASGPAEGCWVRSLGNICFRSILRGGTGRLRIIYLVSLRISQIQVGQLYLRNQYLVELLSR